MGIIHLLWCYSIENNWMPQSMDLSTPTNEAQGLVEGFFYQAYRVKTEAVFKYKAKYIQWPSVIIP